MGSEFVGKFSFVSSENFDEYMKAVGVGMMLRKVAGGLKPDIHIEIKGEEWTITSVSTFKTVVLKFKLGEEFEETTPDGRTVKTTVTLEEGKLCQRQRPIKASDKATEIIRYLQGDQLHTEMLCGSVKCKRVYKRA